MDFKQFSKFFIANPNWFGYMEKESDFDKVIEVLKAYDFYTQYDKTEFDFDEFCEDYWHQPI